MTTPTVAAQANDLGERCSLVIGSFGYMAKSLDRHSIWMADQPWLKIMPQSSGNPGAVYISSNNSLTMRDYDRFSRIVMTDWRDGAGQITYSPTGSSTNRRYLDSNGTDGSDGGRLTIVPSMSQKYTTATSNSFGFPLLASDQYLYMGDVNSVKFSANWSGAPSSAATHTAGSITDMVTDGTYVYASIGSVSIDRFTIGSTSAGTNWAAIAPTRMIYANRRIYGAAVNVLVEVALATGAVTTDFTLPAGYAISDLAALRGGAIDSPLLLLAVSNTGAAVNGGRQTITYYWDGTTIHDYITFPIGFAGERMLQYLGVIYVYGYQINQDATVTRTAFAIVDGTITKLGALGTIQSNGNQSVGSYSADASYGMDAYGNFVYFAVTTTPGDHEVWRYDIVNGGISRYLTFQTATDKNTGDLVYYRGGPWVSSSVQGAGSNYTLFGTNSTFQATGTLTMSDTNLGQPWSANLWATIETTFAPLAAGEQVAIAYSLDAGATFVTTDAAGAAMTATTLGQKSAVFVISNSSSSNNTPYIRPKVTLTAGTSQLTTPSFYSISIKALPSNPSGVILDAWLACSDKQLMPNGQPDWQGASASERLYNIRNLYELQTLVSVIYMAPGATRAKNPVTISCVIDTYEIDYYSPTGFRPGGGEEIGVNGDIHVILREVRA